MASTPFHGGFGLLTLHGVPKPAYRAFQLLHALGTERLVVQRTAGDAGTLELFASRRSGAITVLLYNHDVPRTPMRGETVTVELKGLRGTTGAFVERIDEEHANPHRRWIEMGSPEYPDADEVAELVSASRLQREALEPVRAPEGLSVALTVPPHGVAAVTIGT